MRLCSRYECSWRRQTGRGRKRRSRMTAQPTRPLAPNEGREDGNMSKRGSSVSRRRQKGLWKGACFASLSVWFFISIFCLLLAVFSVTSCFLKSSNLDRLGAQATFSSIAWPRGALWFTESLYPIHFSPGSEYIFGPYNWIEGDSV